VVAALLKIMAVFYSFSWLKPVVVRQSKCSCKRKMFVPDFLRWKLGEQSRNGNILGLEAPFLFQSLGGDARLGEKLALA
jgi:hypothetical protein